MQLNAIADHLREVVNHLDAITRRIATTSSEVISALQLIENAGEYTSSTSILGERWQRDRDVPESDEQPMAKRPKHETGEYDKPSLLLTTLTVDLLAHIFGFLDIRALCALSLVSSKVRVVADALPWRRHFACVGFEAFHPRSQRTEGTRGANFWKDAIIKARKLKVKWAEGGVQKSLAGHDKPIKGLYLSKGHRCITSDDNILKEWDLEGEVILDSFSCASRCICFAADETKLAISSPDAVRIYDVKTKDYLYSLAPGVSTVTSLHMYQRWVVAGLWDGYIRTYSRDNGAVVHTLTGHHNPVYCLHHHKEVICSGSSDRTIKIWNPETKSCVSTFRGHSKTIQAVRINTKARLVVSGSRDHTIRLWDTRTGTTVKTLEDHTDAVTGVQVDYMKIVSASKDSTVRVWDLRTSKPMYIFRDDSNSISCIEFVDNIMASAGENGKVTVWKF